jgi:hypothetical protein
MRAAYEQGKKNRKVGIVLTAVGAGMAVASTPFILMSQWGRKDRDPSGGGFVDLFAGAFLTGAGVQLFFGIPILVSGIIDVEANRPPPAFSLVPHPGGAGFRYLF